MQVLNSSEIKRRFKVGKNADLFLQNGVFHYAKQRFVAGGFKCLFISMVRERFIACGSCSKVRVCIGREQTNSGCVWQEG